MNINDPNHYGDGESAGIALLCFIVLVIFGCVAMVVL